MGRKGMPGLAEALIRHHLGNHTRTVVPDETLVTLHPASWHAMEVSEDRSSRMSHAVSSAYVTQQREQWGSMSRKKPVAPVNPRPDQFPANEWIYHGLAGNSKYKRQDLYCCGIKEIHGIQFKHMFEHDRSGNYVYDPQTAIEMLTEIQKLVRGVERYRPVWVFSEAKYDGVTDTAGKVLAEFIQKHGIGTVVQTPPAYNANSGNNIVAYMWVIPMEFAEWNLEERYGSAT